MKEKTEEFMPENNIKDDRQGRNDDAALRADMIKSVGRGSKIYRLTFGCFFVILLLYLLYCKGFFSDKNFESVTNTALAVNFAVLIILAYLYLKRLRTNYSESGEKI